MAGAKLDRSRDYGVVYGSRIRHAFEQDGKAFDHNGNELPTPQEIVAAKVEKYANKGGRPRKVQLDQVADQLNGV